MLPPFKNEALTDFSQPENVAAFQAALDSVKNKLGKTYPLVINGEEILLDDTFESVNPSRPNEVIGYFANGSAAHVDRAVEAATEAFKSWQYTSPQERTDIILKVAAKLRERKHEFSALMVLEVGKSWVEADADTAEAIDFLEYYARQNLRIADSSDQLADYEPEDNRLVYIPLGVGAIIPPWNFPVAIPTGMLSASLVTGNTVVFKPAEQSPTCGYWIAELMWECGIPRDALNFLTGPGEVVGARMVEHPQTRFVSFTGSREVGVQIYETASKVQPGQKWLKRAILEMGGKDAVVVDETADIDNAVDGILKSAFGFQGQKCSAGSRAIIVASVYDTIAEKLVAAAQNLRVDAPDKGLDVYMGPVIDADAKKKITDYIAIGRNEGELLLGGNTIDTDTGGYFIAPTIFSNVPGDARIAKEEIFGPVLSLVRAKDFDEALEIANSTEYGLTGSVYSSDADRLDRAAREFYVGNLYFNRPCTGALVGIHPFGGFNMSGTDSKAGGPDYLLLYTQAKSIALRR
ncbi:MAG: L-glutamate gamma-semialdehyde dehydrogenase [Chloroflexi bacterium]|nr:MAG: L-glutamate gamma-semialdehyde dehydrogenase [Chloroflexota bacterium]